MKVVTLKKHRLLYTILLELGWKCSRVRLEQDWGQFEGKEQIT